VSIEARIVALEALYAAETLGTAPDGTGLPARAQRMVDGVARHAPDLDAAIEKASRGWRVDRMAVVDRCVLRLALYELLHTETPTAVVIDQAVELAKTYSTARSGRFVNGVLGAIADAMPERASRG
jgi:N utilization substance protein B